MDDMFVYHRPFTLVETLNETWLRIDPRKTAVSTWAKSFCFTVVVGGIVIEERVINRPEEKGVLSYAFDGQLEALLVSGNRIAGSIEWV